MESELPITSPFSVSRKDKNLREFKTWWDQWSVGKNQSKQKDMFKTGQMLIVNMITQMVCLKVWLSDNIFWVLYFLCLLDAEDVLPDLIGTNLIP